MNDPENRLKELFDATADEPSRGELDRLARAAAQIPSGHRRSSWLTWPRLAAAVVAVAAVGAIAIGLDREPPGPTAREDASSPIPSGEPPAEESAELAVLDDDSAWTAEALDEAWLEAPVDDPLAALDGGEADPLAALDMLFAPDDEDLDVYLASYESALGGG